MSATEIVAFSRQTYDDKWQKRFEEDLVELLIRMGQPPQNKVTLVVESLTSGERSVRENVPMTEENRRAIKTAAGERDNTATSSVNNLPPLVALVESILSETADDPLPPQFGDVSAFVASESSKVDAWLQEQVDRAKYPSLNVAVVRGDQIVYQGAFGFEDIEAGRIAKAETSYHVASVTKVFTTSLAVMLHERGVIDLDKPVSDYLPEGVSISTKPERGATIVLRQLASHTSGLPRGVPGKVQSVKGRYELEPQRLYDHLAKAKLEFEPGTDELYSNLAVGLLGHVLELAAKKPFDQLLQEMICEPLHLEHTAIHVNDKFRVATGYGGRTPRRPETHSLTERLRAVRWTFHIGRRFGDVLGGSDESGSHVERYAQAASFRNQTVGRFEGRYGTRLVSSIARLGRTNPEEKRRPK